MRQLKRLWARLLTRQSDPRYPETENVDGFDPAFYCEWYVDMRDKGHAQARAHWLAHGWGEGRWPNLDALLRDMALDAGDLPQAFDWRVYLARYPDLPRAGLATRSQAVVHFLEHGRREQRDGTFNAAFYTGFYPDLAQFADDREAATRHWLDFGRNEGRSPTLRHYAQEAGLPPEAVSDELECGEFGCPDDCANAHGKWTLVARALRQEPPGMPPLWDDAQRNSSFYLALAGWYARGAIDDKAAGLFDALVDTFPAVAHTGLGDIAVRAGWAAGTLRQQLRSQLLAHAHYQAALDHDPEALPPKLGIARALADTACFDGALAAAEDALRLHPDSSEAESMVIELAADAWSAGWATADCLAVQGERKALFARAGRLAGMMFDANARVALRGKPEAVQSRPLRDRVLIIADCQLPQCVRYRIEQKLEQLAAVGYSANAVSWTDPQAARQALAFHDQVIFYRVPAFPQVVRLIAMARMLGKVTFYEIDDLIFDPIYPPPIESYGGFVDSSEYLDLVKGAALFRAAAQLCDFGIASTHPLVEHLRNVVRSGRCFLHRNGLDRFSPINLEIPARPDDAGINIFYGSATRAHNSDFIDEALPALMRVLEEEPRARLTIAGHLRLPDGVGDRLSGRLLELPMTSDLNQYWRALADSDINLAVLLPDVMTDCKSELKWLEAGVLGIPSVVSATRNYRDVISDGQDGLLASGPEGWYAALSQLVSDPGLRRRIGSSARQRALAEYGIVPLAMNLCEILATAADITTTQAQTRTALA